MTLPWSVGHIDQAAVHVVTAASAAYVGPGDIAGFGSALAWYGLRGFTAAYAGPCIDIEDNAQNNPQTINIVGNRLDVAAISAWSAAHSGSLPFVKTLYDQSGNNRHFIKGSTIGAQIALSIISGYPVMTFSLVTGAYFKYTAGLTQAQDYFVSYVARRVTAGVGLLQSMFSTDGANTRLGWATAANTLNQNGQTAAATDNAFHAVQARFSGSASNLMVDGTSTTTNAGTNGMVGTYGMGTNTFAADFDGDATEMGIWAGNIDNAHETSMNTNQHGSSGYNFVLMDTSAYGRF